MDIIVVGNGVAGITCAMTARQRDPKASITVVSGETDYFFSRTALMYAYLDRMGRRELEPFERKTWEAQLFNHKQAGHTAPPTTKKFHTRKHYSPMPQ